MKCTVNVLALPLVSLGWSSLSIRGNNNSGTWTLIWGIWEKKGPEIAAAWLATPSWSTFLPDAGRAPRGWKTTARASCLRRVVSALPLPSLTQMVAWTTSRTPGANQKLCPKYLLGTVVFFFFNPKYLFANFHTFGSRVVSSRTGNIKISWGKLSQTSEGTGIWCLPLNLGEFEGQVWVTAWRGQDWLHVPEFSALSSTLFLRRKSRLGYKT